jgi:hypothetical protein
MGHMVLMKLRGQLIDVIDAKMNQYPMGSLDKRIDVLREFAYEVVEYLDEETLTQLIEQFSK